jgi:hypothetical protein
VTAIITYILHIFEAKQVVYFLSLKPGFSWNVDEVKKTNFENELAEVVKTNQKIFVVMSPVLKKTSSAAGWGEGSATYYAKWKLWDGLSILTIYMDKNESGKLKPEVKTRILRLFIAKEITTKIGAQNDFSTLDRF